ncbi:MAG: BtpA/SgcQ family protein [Candidatus Entotheonellia bacterium]
MSLATIFPHVSKPIIGMLHLPPLPGSYNYVGQALDDIVERTLAEADILAKAGFDGFLMQNAGDRPASLEVCPEKVAYMSVIGTAVRKAHPSTPLGVNVCWNVPKATIAVCHAAGGAFIRLEHVYIGMAITPHGPVYGCAYEATQYLKLLDAKHLQIFADVYEAHSVPIGRVPIEQAAQQATGACQADVVIITGSTMAESLDMIQTIKRTTPTMEVLLGGGSDATNVAEALQHADGVIVGRSLKSRPEIMAPIDNAKACSYMEAVARVRRESEGRRECASGTSE